MTPETFDAAAERAVRSDELEVTRWIARTRPRALRSNFSAKFLRRKEASLISPIRACLTVGNPPGDTCSTSIRNACLPSADGGEIRASRCISGPLCCNTGILAEQVFGDGYSPFTPFSRDPEIHPGRETAEPTPIANRAFANARELGYSRRAAEGIDEVIYRHGLTIFNQFEYSQLI